MRIGYNIHGNNVPDKARLLTHLERLQPAWLLVMDNLDLALELQNKLPATQVIFRVWPDDDLVERFTPEDWVAYVVARAPVNLWLYAGNEQGFSDKVLEWNARVIEVSAIFDAKLVVGNFSSGTPANPDDWKRPAARRLLNLCHQHRNRVVLGLHEYACGVVTSGFIGGNPVFIQPSSWPRSVEDVVLWHLGRVHRLLEACDTLAIEPPRIVVTESGFDDMSDIKAWAETLIKTPGYANIRGWKSLERQWQAWWNWSPQQAYYEQMKYAASVIYRATPVEGLLLYSWGASSEQWQQFDLSGAQEFHALLETKEVVVPVGNKRYRVAFDGFKVLNLRGTPSGLDVGDVLAGDELFVYPASDMPIGPYTWVQVDHFPAAGGEGKKGVWVAATYPGLIWTPVELPPPQPPPTPPPVITWLQALTPAARDLAQFLTINKEVLNRPELGLLHPEMKPILGLFSEMAVLLDHHFEV